MSISRLTSRQSGNSAFFSGEHRSPWYMVAFGMIGASISGVTFVSVPGMVLQQDMTYLQTCLGFILGYYAVAYILLPLYYRLRLTTIYTYLGKRLGHSSHLTGTIFFAQGDILLVVFTLTMASVCLIIAAYAVDSPYSQIGAERELVQTMAYEPMLLMVALGFYLASGSFSVGDILTGAHMNILRMPGIFFGLCFILLIKFRKSPFDISMSHEAHQELIGGLKTEISGRTLAVVEIAHWYENVFLFGLVLLFFASDTWWTWLLGLAICEIVFFAEILIDNCCARIKWERMLASTWLVGLMAGFLNIAFLMYFK